MPSSPSSPARLPNCTQCINGGVHFVVEKPFALSLAEGRRIVQLAGRKRVQIVAGQNYRYQGDLAAMAQLVRAGAVGQLGAADSAKALTSKTCGTIISGKWRCTISI